MRLFSFANLAISTKSTIFNNGFVGVSTHIIFVLEVIDVLRVDKSLKSEKVNLSPADLFLTSSNNLYVPPYKSSIAST